MLISLDMYEISQGTLRSGNLFFEGSGGVGVGVGCGVWKGGSLYIKYLQLM